MKFRTVLATTAGVGIGYVLGARAGRAKFDELKAQAQRIVTDPDVRQKVADLPTQVRENLPKAQAAVSDAIKGASTKVQSAKSGHKSSDDSSAQSATFAADAVPTSDTAVTPEATLAADATLDADATLVGDAPVADDAPLTSDPLLDPDATLGADQTLADKATFSDNEGQKY